MKTGNGFMIPDFFKSPNIRKISEKREEILKLTFYNAISQTCRLYLFVHRPVFEELTAAKLSPDMKYIAKHIT